MGLKIYKKFIFKFSFAVIFSLFVYLTIANVLAVTITSASDRIELVEQMVANQLSNPSVTIKLYQKHIDKTITIKQLNLYLKSLFAYSRALIRSGDFQNICTAHEKIKSINIEGEENVHLEASIMDACAFGLFKMSRYKEALKLGKKTLNKRLSFANNNKELSRSHMRLGSIYKHMANYELSLKHFEQAINYASRLNNNNLQATIYSNLAGLYVRQKKYQQAKAHYEQGIVLAEEVDDAQILTQLYFNLANMLLAKGKVIPQELKEVKKYIEKLEKINAKRKHERSGYLIDLLNVQYSLEVGEYKGLEPKILSLIKYFQKHKEYYKETGVLLDLSIYYQSNGQLELAIEAASKSLLLSQKNELKYLEVKAIEYLRSFYKAAGEYETALNWLEKEVELRNIILTENTDKMSALFNERLNTLKKENEVKELKAEKLQQVYFSVALAGVLLSFILAFFIIFNKVNAKRKEVEKESVYKSKFLAALSHEIRNPLNSIVGVSQLYSHNLIERERVQLMDILSSSSEVLLGLVNEVLDLSKIEAGEATLNNTKNSLIDVMDKVVMTMYSMANQQNNLLSLIVDDSVPEYCHFDASKLSQVIINILSNAIKNTENGTIKIILAYSNGKLTITIVDSGVGIEQSEIKNIFKPFRQLEHESDKLKFQSSGLGLAITSEIINLMQGKVSVTSEVSKGTTFTIVLPLKAVGGENHTRRAQLIESLFLFAQDTNDFNELRWRLKRLNCLVRPIKEKRLLEKMALEKDKTLVIALNAADSVYFPYLGNDNLNTERSFWVKRASKKVNQQFTSLAWPTTQNDLKRVLNLQKEQVHLKVEPTLKEKESRLLVVDDDATSRSIVTRMLTRLGYQCDTAKNGREAVEAAVVGGYSLIFMDSIMPVLSGPEATTQILSGVLEKKPIIVGLSGSASIEDIEVCTKAGMKRCLVKPIKMSELKEVLDESINIDR